MNGAGGRIDPMAVVGPGEHDALTDVEGIEVGHDQRVDPPYRTGTTAVVTRAGAVCGVDVRGGAPATHETDLVDPARLVDLVQAVVLTGGSSFGLAACAGVMAFLEEQGLGWPVGDAAHEVVPIVPAAAIYDLGRGGSFTARPDASFGHRAASAAGRGPVAEGNVGAGTGAEVGRLVGAALKGGLGTASVRTAGGVTVAALVVVNAAGSAVDPRTGILFAAHLLGTGRDGPRSAPERAEVAAHFGPGPATPSPANTVLGVVATDVSLSRGEASRFATVAHDGLARAVRPAHTIFDGDVFFALSTRRISLPVTEGELPTDRGGRGGGLARSRGLAQLFEIGADCVERAVAHAVLAAVSVPGAPSYRATFPSAFSEADRRTR